MKEFRTNSEAGGYMADGDVVKITHLVRAARHAGTATVGGGGGPHALRDPTPSGGMLPLKDCLELAERHGYRGF